MREQFNPRELPRPIDVPPFIERDGSGQLYLVHRSDAGFDTTDQLKEFLKSKGKKLPETKTLDEILPGYLYIDNNGRIISEGQDDMFSSESWEEFISNCPAI
jgi:hypothetical protein